MLLADGGGFTVNGVLVSATLWVLVMAFVYTGFRMGRRPAIDKLESGDSGVHPSTQSCGDARLSAGDQCS